MMLAMLMAITVQMMVIGGYHLSEWLKVTDDIKVSPFDGRIIDLLPPPPLHPINEGGIIPIIAANLANGIPVAVPDAVVDTSIKYASQIELAEVANKAFANLGEELGNGVIVIPNNESDLMPRETWQVEILPIAVVSPKPEYPDIAVKVGMEGFVTVKVLLDKEGRVQKKILMKASEDIFAQPALDAAQKWVFTPALMNGKPVQVWISIPFRFMLAGK
jgi:protein TonB